MRAHLATLIGGTILAALLFLAAPAAASGPVAKIENTGKALVFHPVIEAARYTLTVGGPCDFHYQQVVEGGELVFKLGEETIDGTYQYSLVATPYVDPKLFEILREARERGDDSRVRELCRAGKGPPAATIQAGEFAVLKQTILIDTVPESQRRSDRDEAP